MAQGHAESEEIVGSRKVGLAPPNINVTPLVDVLLVLLIIFFVIQPQKEAKFESQIPQKPQDTQDAPVPFSDLLMVVVKSGSGVGMEQSVELNSKPMTLIELGSTLEGYLEQRPDKTVFIKAAKEKLYGDIVKVIDVVKGAGATPIGLQIDFLE